MPILITGATLVSETDTIKSDLFISGEKITRLGPDLFDNPDIAAQKPEIIDASNLYVFPGGIDPHTHMELPLAATTSCDTFETGSRAALMGGTTTIIDYANQTRGASALKALEAWHQKAAGKTFCDYSFHVAITDFNPAIKDELRILMDREGIPSFKTFMAYPSLRMNDRTLLSLMDEFSRMGALMLTHAENGDMIEHLTDRFRAEGKLAPRFHALAHPSSTEGEACSRLIDLAQLTGCALYIVHLSSKDGLDRARIATRRIPKRRKNYTPIFLETCIQYLVLEDSLYQKPNGANYILSPPLRSTKDRLALWRALGEDQVNTLGTDHCPFTQTQREIGKDDFSKIPNGIGGVEHRMELLFSEGVLKDRITLSQFVSLTSSAAARIFGLYPRKGSLKEGADADLVIFDPQEKHTISSASHHSNTDFSVYEGQQVTGRCKKVFLRGQLASNNGKFYLPQGAGLFLKRAPVRYKTAL